MRLCCILLAVAACNHAQNTTTDAPVVPEIDAPQGPPPTDAPNGGTDGTTGGGTYDFSCAGTTAATTATPTVKLSGSAAVIDVANNALVTGPLAATITIYNQFGGAVTTVQPDAQGAFATTPIPTGGAALAYVAGAADPANEQTRFEPPHPDGVDDGALRLFGFSTAGKAAFDSLAFPGGTGYSSYLFACVTDCAGTPIPGLASAAFKVQQVGAVTVDASEMSVLLGSSFAGCYAIRLPQPGGATISVEADMHAFPAVAIRNELSAVYSTVLRPGA